LGLFCRVTATHFKANPLGLTLTLINDKLINYT